MCDACHGEFDPTPVSAANAPLDAEGYKRLIETNYQGLRPKQEATIHKPEPVKPVAKPPIDGINRVKHVGDK